MSLTKSELIEKNQYQLTFSVDKATFEAAVNKAYRMNATKINIPGFRKGKAPRAIIEKMYGKGAFYEDAINEIIPDAYEEAAKASGLDIVGRPEFDVETIDDNGVVLIAKVFVKPEVKIDGYKGIKVTRNVAPVTDDDVDAEVNRVAERNSRMTEVTDRAALLGDTTNIDFEGFESGVAFDGGKGEGFDLVLGSGQFIPGFEDQIVGHEIGEEFDVNVTFPEDYSAENLKGKPAVFKVKINSIKLKELPAIDDEFARDVSEFDTIAEYKADVKVKLEARNANAADREVEDQLIAALIEKVEADIPECMFEAEVENFIRDYDNRLRMQGMELKTYFQYTGLNLDTMREQVRPQAENQVKTRLALEAIAAIENIAVTDEDIEGEYTNIAAAYGMTVEEVKKAAPADAIAEDMKVKKAVDFVKENADISDAAPKKKAPAKRKTTKKADAETEEAPAETAEAPKKKAPAKKKTTTKKAEAPAEEAPKAE